MFRASEVLDRVFLAEGGMDWLDRDEKNFVMSHNGMDVGMIYITF